MEYKPPNAIVDRFGKTVFLAGSIEMGVAERWQDKAATELLSHGFHVVNPRREDWDNSWKQEYENIHFRDQVIWEQFGIQNADYVLFYFDPNTKSPITLLELGLCIGLKKKMVVCCKDEFYRYGNIKVMCHMYGINLIDDLDDAIYMIRQWNT